MEELITMSSKPNLCRLIANDFVLIKEGRHWQTWKNGRRQVYYLPEYDEVGGELIFGDNPEKLGFMFIGEEENVLKKSPSDIRKELASLGIKKGGDES